MTVRSLYEQLISKARIGGPFAIHNDHAQCNNGASHINDMYHIS